MSDVILFDFFGTLVRYQPDRTILGYPSSRALVAELGWEFGHDEFVTAWDVGSRALESRCAASLREPSMVDYAAAFAEQVGIELSEQALLALATTFTGEWAEHVRPIDGAGEMLVTLGRTHRLGIVSNTNDSEMVPRLAAEYFADVSFEHIVLSVDHGFRKPHPSMYETTLTRFEVESAQAVFVGDSYEPDCVGPTATGMRALLIDPTARHPVPAANRLDSVLDLADRV
ncbi:MAG TPA: HAD family hydrolase [Acidimicrobiales bacterium]|nr:HAD family hydrolase [Acidimicrobiales bacterium]